jgi:hypothetical protein
VRAVNNITDFVTSIKIWTEGNEFIEIDLNSVKFSRPNLPYNCMILDIDENPEVREKKVRQIFFNFDAKIYGLEVHPVGREFYTDREIQQNTFFYSGEMLYQLKSVKNAYTNALMLTLSQEIFVEGDKNQNCNNYPNSRFDSYNDCDKDFIKRVLSTFKPSFVPFWATDNMTEATTFFVWNFNETILPNNTVDYEDLPDGVRNSDCPLPCTQTYVDSRFISKREYRGTIPDSIIVTFSETVQITTSDFPPFSFLDYLSRLGGLLGLWLGLGVVQIFELLGSSLAYFCSTFCGRRKDTEQ